MLLIRSGTRALWDGWASCWSQRKAKPFGQHVDIPAQRVGHTACALNAPLTLWPSAAYENPSHVAVLFLCVTEGGIESYCFHRWHGCWTFFRITWNTEVSCGSVNVRAVTMLKFNLTINCHDSNCDFFFLNNIVVCPVNLLLLHCKSNNSLIMFY